MGPGLSVGDEVTVEVGVAHGGHFVARHEGRVFFVRGVLPGERAQGAGHRGRTPWSLLSPSRSRC